MCAQIVEAVSQCQCLRICKTLVHFLDTPMDITAVSIDLTNNFTFKRNAEAHYTVSCRVLRANVDYILFFSKEFHFSVFNRSVRIKFYFLCCIERLFVSHTKRIIFLRIIIFTHGVSYPVIT